VSRIGFWDGLYKRIAETIGVALLLVAAASTHAAAQPGFTVTLGRAHNAFSDGEATDSEQTTTAAVLAEQYSFDERLRLFYSLDSGSFTTPGDWTYLEHAAGTSWRFGAADESRPALFVGATGTWRTNGVSWTAADFRGFGAFANVEWRPRPTGVMRAGYSLDIRNFAEVDELDQVEHDIFSSFLANLPSRTTLIGEVHVGAKSYKAGARVESGIASGSEARGGAGTGRGPGSWLGEGTAGAISVAQGSGSAARVLLLGRVAQSLSDRAGLSLQYSRNISSGAVPDALVVSPVLFVDDGVYDDPFASNARNWRAALKVLGRGMQVDVVGLLSRKDYREMPAISGDGQPLADAALRADRIGQVGVSWTLPALTRGASPIRVRPNLEYWLTRRRSNSEPFNYESHAAAVAVVVSY
jgi:hypothetical protein